MWPPQYRPRQLRMARRKNISGLKRLLSCAARAFFVER
jgi:hypothetical protein